MAKKEQLRHQRTGTVINVTSRQQETDIIKALKKVETNIVEKFANRIVLCHEKQWYLKDIVEDLKFTFPETNFTYHFPTSHLRPDGGILHIRGKHEDRLRYPILIAEVKNQGTNDQRAEEGLLKQAKGNAIERLGKNLIGLRTALLREEIFPFVCFGYGCDFASDSSILDRVCTMAMFGELNVVHLYKETNGINRGSFFFRQDVWTVDEMYDVMKDIAERSIFYYFSKYGEDHFLHPDPNVE